MKYTESQIQSDFFAWANAMAGTFPQLRLLHAIPNGANKSIAARMKFKREGLKSGVPDVCLPVAGSMDAKRRNALYIEFKSDKGVISPEQRQWINDLRAAGNWVSVCRSWPSAAKLVCEYLGITVKGI